MTYTILIDLQADAPEPNRVQKTRLEAAVQQTLDIAQASDDAMVSVIINTDEYIRELNRRYRQIDAPTDVLSFPHDPPEGIDDDEGYLGDIALGLPYIMKRVQTENRDLHDELCLLLIHATLHLLGYDHDNAENQAEMWALQAQVLKTLNIDLIVPDYIHE